MKRLACVSGLVFGLACCVAGAQEQPMHAPDGGTRERVESLTILPATNALFTATVTTEWTTILVDGSRRSGTIGRLPGTARGAHPAGATSFRAEWRQGDHTSLRGGLFRSEPA